MMECSYYRFGRFLTDLLSRSLFRLGVEAHWRGSSERAAYYLFNSYMGNPDNIDAGKAYRHEMELLVKGGNIVKSRRKRIRY